jgi:predicted RNase H-like nuclease (RuvC/YqgF family)
MATRCIGITSRDTRCLKSASSNSSYCHIHSKIEASKTLQDLQRSCSLIPSLKSEIGRLLATIELLEDENMSLQTQLRDKKLKVRPEQKSKYLPPKEWDPKDPRALKMLSNKQAEVNILTKRLAEANATIHQLRPDYDRYQIIKSYEALHKQLEQKRIGFNHRGDLYHDLRLTRNQVAHPRA